jgi:transcriptional regulator with XRE-family HTH domain
MRELSYRDFATLIEQRTGVVIAFASLSRWEKDEGEPALAQIKAIAKVDPLNRGAVWLSGLVNGTAGDVDKTVAPTPQNHDRPKVVDGGISLKRSGKKRRA